MEKNEKLRRYLDHYDAEIYTSYTDEDNCSFHIYRENTADGYEVFIAKYKADNYINVIEYSQNILIEYNQYKYIANKIRQFRNEFKIDNKIKHSNYTKPNLRKKLFEEIKAS